MNKKIIFAIAVILILSIGAFLIFHNSKPEVKTEVQELTLGFQSPVVEEIPEEVPQEKNITEKIDDLENRILAIETKINTKLKSSTATYSSSDNDNLSFNEEETAQEEPNIQLSVSGCVQDWRKQYTPCK